MSAAEIAVALGGAPLDTRQSPPMTGLLPELRLRIEEIACAVLGEPNKRLSTRTQLRFGTNGSVAVEIAGERRGEWYDHEAESGGGPWELLTTKGRMTNGDAIGWLHSRLGINIRLAAKGPRDPIATYDYRDERGDLLFQVCRFEPKTFRQRRSDGKGGWTWSVKALRRVLYRLPELLAAPAHCVAFVVEGEKDVDRLASLGLVATCNPGGAGKWRGEFAEFFRGRDVVILPDNDDAGRAHARSVAASLAPVAVGVRILELPGLPPKGDVSDWLYASDSVEELQRLAADVPPYQPEDGIVAADRGNAVDDDAEIVRLATLRALDYDRERSGAAEKLGCRAAILDKLVAAARDKMGIGGAGKSGYGKPIEIPDTEPWSEPVSGAELLDELVRAIRQYVILTPNQATAVALWAVFTHAFEAFDVSPKLVIQSPEMRSGKTRLVEVLDRIVRRSLFASGISAAALLRVIEQHAPAMLLDEIDTLMKGGPEMAEALRGLINSGFDRAGARHIKNAPTLDGGFEPRAFSTWCPTLLAGIGTLPDTISDRSISIEMKRKRPDEKVRRLRARDGVDLRELGRKATRWADDNCKALETADPETPAQLHDRASDAWSPLLAIADLAGGEWPERARQAATELSGGNDDKSIRVKLLADIQAAFDTKKLDRLSSEDLVSYLVELDDRWTESRGGKPITKPYVARLLKPLGISPGTIRLGDGRTAKGYYREAFEDVFARYLPLFENVTTSQAKQSAAFGGIENVTTQNHVTFRNHENLSISAGCDVVTDRKPLWWRDDDSERPDRDPEEAVWME